jgi:hypothetical protein
VGYALQGSAGVSRVRPARAQPSGAATHGKGMAPHRPAIPTSAATVKTYTPYHAVAFPSRSLSAVAGNDVGEVVWMTFPHPTTVALAAVCCLSVNNWGPCLVCVRVGSGSHVHLIVHKL